MKKNIFLKLLNLALIYFLSSCSFFNHKNVELSIDSSPRGAEIYINQQFYGNTPALIKIEPKNHIVSLNLNGYGGSSFQTPVFWGSIRTDADGSINADGVRCLLDLVSVIFSFQAYSGKCADFKQKQYKISIPKNYFYNSYNASQSKYEFDEKYSTRNYGGGFSNYNDSSLMVGAGQNPQNVINYYYKQDSVKSIDDLNY
ncbi:MAG: PEGA domain-containing protein [Proteobacteria bacterium]|nr:PEGA domain-containing protein [Pseudomonadota bacterium]